ncbi:MAG: glycosyltransferase family 4 protein [Cyanothece sp. SIO1E1]|nr:glycosyltransferase family 4 protein [Cyanothece sp. SIO1E1]
MRVLFISSTFPGSDLRVKVHGLYQRMSMFVDAIKHIAQLDMLFYVPAHTDTSPSTVSALTQTLSKHWQTDINLCLCPKFKRQGQYAGRKRYWSGLWSIFKQPGYIGTSGIKQVQELEACLDQKPDAVFVHRLPSMSPLLLTRKALPPIFFDLDDIEHIALTRHLNQQSKAQAHPWSTYLQLPALWWGEYCAIRQACKTFVCSETDRHYLSKKLRLPGIVTIPNAVPMPEPQPVPPEPTLLFIGSYTYPPNVDAAEFLIEQIWPQVHQALPSARLLIAGASPHNIRGYTTGLAGVEFTGFVDDLDALYRRARVVCCPVRSGGGTRIKLIEAAAYGKAIVSTRIGAEGLNLKECQDIVLQDHPQFFAQACLTLLQDAERCQHLGTAARQVAIQHYDRDNILQSIQQCLKV